MTDDEDSSESEAIISNIVFARNPHSVDDNLEIGEYDAFHHKNYCDV